jgi:hypothetical protein
MKSVETDLGPVCSRCASAVPPRMTCKACGRSFASASECTRAVAQRAIAIHDARRAERRRLLRAILRGQEGVPG